MAIKAVNGERLNAKLTENLTIEVSVMKQFSSPNIVELYDLQRAGPFVYLVMEYCEGGDLAGLLRRRHLLPEAEARDLVRQLAVALQVLVRANFAHRDLKPQNLLLTRDAQGATLLKLGDFGFARFVDPKDMAETLCGSPLYMAPEILRYEKYDGRADLWSVGAILYEMLYGRPPFRAQNHIQLLRIIERAPQIVFPDTVFVSEADREHPVVISEECRRLLLGLLQKNPEERLSFDQFFTHPFFKEAPVPEKAVEEKTLMGTGPGQLIRGFAIPRGRSRSSSGSGLSSSLRQPGGERRSSLSTSLRAQSFQSPAVPNPSPSASASLSVREELLFRTEQRLKELLAGLEKTARPALLRAAERDVRLAMVLKDLVDANRLLIGSSEGRALVLETMQMALLATALLQHTLGSIRDASPPIALPSDDSARALVLWLAERLQGCQEAAGQLRKRMEDAAGSIQIGQSMTSSQSTSDTLPPATTSELLYNQALRTARDAGLQELLGHQAHAELLYAQSLFLLEILAGPGRPLILLEAGEPAPSQQDQRILQGYINVIQQRIVRM